MLLVLRDVCGHLERSFDANQCFNAVETVSVVLLTDWMNLNGIIFRYCTFANYCLRLCRLVAAYMILVP